MIKRTLRIVGREAAIFGRISAVIWSGFNRESQIGGLSEAYSNSFEKQSQMTKDQNQMSVSEKDSQNSTNTHGLLSQELLAHIGRSTAPRTEIASRREIRKYSIATGWKKKEYLDGDIAPPLFHLALFWDMVELDQLSPDGVSIDRLLPKFPLEKAMAGGLDIEYFRPIHAGDVLVATRTLTNIYEKAGSQGPIIFYEVIMRVETEAGEPVLTEKTTRLLR